MGQEKTYPFLYRSFFQRFHEGEYWEAHEVLEELWQKERENDFYHGLIQVAAIMHQLKRGKVRGARKLAKSATGYLTPFAPKNEGVDVALVLYWLQNCLEMLPKHVRQMDPSEVEALRIAPCPLPQLR